MTKEEYIEFATALKNNYTIDFDKLPEFCNMAISALSENKGDKISRQAVLELLQMKYFGKDLYKAIYELPSVENKGEWIHILDSYYEDGTERESHWECSKCGSSRSGWGEFKFCPDCGADMRPEPYKKGE